MSDEDEAPPPPDAGERSSSGPPNEYEAWKQMMDSMMSFITSSTKLLNSMNNRASGSSEGDAASDGAGSGADASSEDKKCVAPCNKSGSGEIGVCADECVVCKNKKGNECGICGVLAEGEEPTENENTSLCVCSQIRKIKDEARKAGVNVDGQAGEGEGKKCEGAESEKTRNCACAGDKPQSLKGACDCAPRNHRGPDPKTQLCSCEVGPNEEANLADTVVARLNKAQEEIQQLQKEMSRLQTLENIRQSKTAALYKEIMRDGPGLPSSSRRGGGGACATSRGSVSFAGPPGACAGCSSQQIPPSPGAPTSCTSCGNTIPPQGQGRGGPMPTMGSSGIRPSPSGYAGANRPIPPGARCSGICTQTSNSGPPNQHVEEYCVDYSCDDQCITTTETRRTRVPAPTPPSQRSFGVSTNQSGGPQRCADGSCG